MDIHSKIIVCTTLDENGNVVRKDRFENSFEKLEVYISISRKVTVLSWNPLDLEAFMIS